ncbi:hypothetical protein E5S67_02440 [Microcoleus sp. IPMA8]|uniref:Transposase n=1 Tax=Microcoleus asticus IPMA8 TaxID=2563858 RepID=A0ABX2CY76_9CYAN|nr:hypothetical protein [Microcoleus asticus IPMA8]
MLKKLLVFLYAQGGNKILGLQQKEDDCHASLKVILYKLTSIEYIKTRFIAETGFWFVDIFI